MKKGIKMIFAIFTLVGLIAPSAIAQAKPLPSSINVSGTINMNDDYVVFINDLRNPKNIKEIPISKEGTFSWKSNLKSAGFIKLTVMPKSKNRQLGIDFPLYVSNGSDLQLNLKYSDSTYLTLLPSKIDGSNKALIEYSNYCFLKMREMFRDRSSTPEGLKKNILSYLETSDNYIKKFAVTNEMVKRYMAIWAMNNYMSRLSSLPREVREGLPYSPQHVYNDGLALLFNETSSSINQYINMVIKNELYNKDEFEKQKLKFKKLDSLFTNQDIIGKIIDNNLQEFIRSYNFKANANFEEELAKFQKLTVYLKDEKRRIELVNNFNNLKFTLKGSALPNEVFKDPEGKDVKLQTYAGNYIYIDLWASWCKPCIAEIPNLHKLEKEYKDKNVVFVSISLDADKSDWKKKMAELKLEGNQLHLGDSMYDKLMNISGIPHFILYDPTGKLVMYKAPRPGTDEIKAFFDKNLRTK